MKDMTIVLNKKIVNKETGEVRLVVNVDEAERKIFSVPESEPESEPTVMAAASYDRRWRLYEETEEFETAEEPVTKTVEAPTEEAAAVEETTAQTEEPMKMSDVVTKLENLFDLLNAAYFENKLPKPVITVQSTPKFYGHCSTKKIWKSENDARYEINIGAEYLNRPSADTAATMCHEMVISTAWRTVSTTPARRGAITIRPSRPSASCATWKSVTTARTATRTPLRPRLSRRPSKTPALCWRSPLPASLRRLRPKPPVRRLTSMCARSAVRRLRPPPS